MRHRVALDGQQYDPRLERCRVRKRFMKALLQCRVLKGFHSDNFRLETSCDEFRADPGGRVPRVERIEDEHLVAGADVGEIVDQVGDALLHGVLTRSSSLEPPLLSAEA